ncbi:hypothetical protein QVD17_03569 [Tagetes erecta]|uniref:Uncharacterized protein n=1 Tax=Tagetes erecta TaxID=13708 RepID=A0AAD8LEU6_TARER|nr:hypothetical protein QVD17_03569 [Tagetes erecta]
MNAFSCCQYPPPLLQPNSFCDYQQKSTTNASLPHPLLYVVINPIIPFSPTQDPISHTLTHSHTLFFSLYNTHIFHGFHNPNHIVIHEHDLFPPSHDCNSNHLLF